MVSLDSESESFATPNGHQKSQELSLVYPGPR